MIDDDRPRDAASLARFMAEIEARGNEEIERPESDSGPVKTIKVRWTPGDRVRVKGDDPMEVGWVTQCCCNPGNIAYKVAFPDPNRDDEHHYDFELEDAGD